MFAKRHDLGTASRRRKLASRRLSRAIADHRGMLIAGAAAIVGVIGVGITAGLLLRRRWRSTYHNPYESRAFRRKRVADSEYEAVGI